jgi:hypothetical protein
VDTQAQSPGDADVTVIIPSKNRLWSLPKAVASCRSARLRVQILVIDDSSSDGTAEWLAGQPDVEGVAGDGWGKPWGINRAWGRVRGRYVRFLDSDDWLPPLANESQLEAAERADADLVVAGFDLYAEEVLSRKVPWEPTDDFIAQQLGEGSGSHYSAFLFRRTFVSGVPHRTLFPASDFASRDDRCFMLEVALMNPRIAEGPGPALCHRQHARDRLQFHGGMRRDGTHIQHLYVYRQILGILERRGELSERRRKAAAAVLWPLAHWIAYSHIDEACDVARWACELDPSLLARQRGALGGLYRTLGFRATERILGVRRALLSVAGAGAGPA